MNSALGYILVRKDGTVQCHYATDIQFYSQLNPDLKVRFPLYSAATRFHVYYKDKNKWAAVPNHFKSLSETIPYLQNGIRVLVEYEKSCQSLS